MVEMKTEERDLYERFTDSLKRTELYIVQPEVNAIVDEDEDDYEFVELVINGGSVRFLVVERK